MPMYEYMCVVCGSVHEKLVPSAQADAPQACPKCGSDRSRRQLSVFSFGGGRTAAPAAPASRGFT